jgi:hypothetical protein
MIRLQPDHAFETSSIDQYLIADGRFTIARPATGDPGAW